MNENKYELDCTSIGDDKEKIVNRYPVLKNYKLEIEHPYENPDAKRLVITVNNLRKFYDDINREIILSKDDDMYSLEIYDDYRE